MVASNGDAGMAAAAVAISAAVLTGHDKETIENGARNLLYRWGTDRQKIAKEIQGLRVLEGQKHRVVTAQKLLGVWRGK